MGFCCLVGFLLACLLDFLWLLVFWEGRLFVLVWWGVFWFGLVLVVFWFGFFSFVTTACLQDMNGEGLKDLTV